MGRRQRIVDAVRMIQTAGDKVSVSLVARVAAVGRNTARKYLSEMTGGGGDQIAVSRIDI
jgi:hypothetical protein